MSYASRTVQPLETQVAAAPDIDTQPVEPPPTPPGGEASPVYPKEHPSEGSFSELTSAGVARGWALDRDDPAGAIFVYFYVDGEMSWATYAGAARADLPGTAGTQGANHAFSWRIPDTYRDGVLHTLYAYAIDRSGYRRDSPLLGKQSFLLQPGNELPAGGLEKIDGDGKVTGWAVDPNTSHLALTVSFYVSAPDGDVVFKRDVPVGQVSASLPRPDVNEATGCRGDHGFEWSIPLEFRDGQTHKLHAYVDDTATQGRTSLKGSPKLFTLLSEK